MAGERVFSLNLCGRLRVFHATREYPQWVEADVQGGSNERTRRS
jgi:hypothetical protein